jgi:hypothetical protein
LNGKKKKNQVNKFLFLAKCRTGLALHTHYPMVVGSMVVAMIEMGSLLGELVPL